MRDLIIDLRFKGLALLSRLVTRHWRKSRAAWESALNEPAPGRRLLYLVCGLLIAFCLIPSAFHELGVMGGFSYLTALFGAVSNATFFRVARVGRAYYPLGLVAPIAIFVGLAGSAAVRPMLGDAKNAALAQDFVGALIILAVFGVFSLWFRQWRHGNPYA